jgi:hypothetical protein
VREGERERREEREKEERGERERGERDVYHQASGAALRAVVEIDERGVHRTPIKVQDSVAVGMRRKVPPCKSNTHPEV